jgi:hypothetical protein
MASKVKQPLNDHVERLVLEDMNKRFHELLMKNIWAGTMPASLAPPPAPRAKKTLRTRWKAIKRRFGYGVNK